MKLPFAALLLGAAAVVGAAAIAGSAPAQSQDGVYIPLPATTRIPGHDVGYKPEEAATLLAARYKLRRACAADMLARCPDKDGGAADRCLEYHRLGFTLPCRKAITAFERAAPPRTSYESLASLAPISGPIPPASEREAPSRPSPRAGTGD
jgi:hypothetical protein